MMTVAHTARKQNKNVLEVLDGMLHRRQDRRDAAGSLFAAA